MNINSIIFELKDVIALTIAVASLLGFYFRLKRQLDKLYIHVDELEKKHNESNKSVMEALEENKKDFEKREINLHDRINEVRNDNINSYQKLESKIDIIFNHLSTITSNLAEITGFIRGTSSKRQ
jgi:predicted Holliday junction resolvase-like endonuclease